MKINDREVSDVVFIARDEVTDLEFGGRIDFRGEHPDYKTKTEIYFSHIQELEGVIEMLTNMHDMAIKHRDEWRQY